MNAPTLVRLAAAAIIVSTIAFGAAGCGGGDTLLGGGGIAVVAIMQLEVTVSGAPQQGEGVTFAANKYDSTGNAVGTEQTGQRTTGTLGDAQFAANYNLSPGQSIEIEANIAGVATRTVTVTYAEAQTQAAGSGFATVTKFSTAAL